MILITPIINFTILAFLILFVGTYFELRAQGGEDCATATFLTLNLDNTCIGDIHDINMVGSRPDVQNPAPTCGNFRSNTNDRWVKFQVPNNVQGLSFSLSRVLTNPLDISQQAWAVNMAIYRGTNCSNLQLLGCHEATLITFPFTIATDPVNATYRNLVPGETIWIRIWERNNNRIQMKLAISTAIDPPINDNCLTPLPLTPNGCNMLARGGDIPPPDECGWSSTDNSVFYYFEVTSATPRPVRITIDNVRCTGGGGNIQLAIYKWNGVNCNGIGGNNPLTYHGCAAGVGSVTVTATPANLPNGKYILAVDGESGANCSFGFSGSVVQEPLKVFIKGPTRACAQSCVIFSDSTIGTPTEWSWYFEGGTPSFANVRNPGPVCYPLPGTYKVRLQVRTASAQANYETSITISPNPVVKAGDDIRLCKGSSYQLQGEVNNGTPPYIYRWRPALYLSDSSQLQPFATPLHSITYTLDVVDQKGCRHQSSVTIEVIESDLNIEISKDTIVCLGQNVPLWAKVKGGAGNYTFEWKPTEGLDNPNSLTPVAMLRENRVYTLSVTDGVCEKIATVQIFIHSPFKLILPEKQAICLGDTIVLSALAEDTSVGFPLRWVWQPSMGLASIRNPVTKAYPSQNTTYTLHATDGICSKEQTVEVNVTTDFDVFIGKDTTLCIGQRLTLFPEIKGGSGIYTYYWLPQMGLIDPTERNPTLQPPKSLAYIFRASDGVCHKQDTIYIRIIDDFEVAVSPDTTICQGQSVMLRGTIKGGLGNYTFQWFPDSSLARIQTLNPTAIPKQTTIYTLVASDGICQAQATANIIVVPNKLNLIFARDTHICKGEWAKVVVQVSGGDSTKYTYQWSPAEFLQTPQSAQSLARPLSTTIYTVTVTDGICQKQGNFTVYVQPPIRLLPLADTTICKGKEIKITPKIENLSSERISYLWKPNVGINSETSSSPIFSPQVTQTYTLVVTNDFCQAKDSFKITVQDFIPYSRFSFSPHSGTAPLEVTFFNQSNTTQGLVWQFMQGEKSTEPNPIYTFTKAGTYTITLIAGTNTPCPDTTSQVLVVYPLNLIVPNVFTPNGDGVNDKWVIVAEGIKEIRIVVFDRWGSRVWETYHLNDFWEGFCVSKPCPPGTYFYKISAITNEDKSIERTGQVTILR
ncbi:MAG: gliding motility-associated C-terminal domain-containing protein [Bacteroidia bacterium]|nr:gliding motility-associated C-terminal domain-containing protein [Bacteroidia bacterium]